MTKAKKVQFVLLMCVLAPLMIIIGPILIIKYCGLLNSTLQDLFVVFGMVIVGYLLWYQIFRIAYSRIRSNVIKRDHLA